MADLTNLDSVAGKELTTTQIQGVLQQIDLDITNLVRDGKLSAIKYSVPGSAGQSTDRASNLSALLTARDHYQKLQIAMPSWSTSQASLD